MKILKLVSENDWDISTEPEIRHHTNPRYQSFPKTRFDFNHTRSLRLHLAQSRAHNFREPFVIHVDTFVEPVTGIVSVESLNEETVVKLCKENLNVRLLHV